MLRLSIVIWRSYSDSARHIPFSLEGVVGAKHSHKQPALEMIASTPLIRKIMRQLCCERSFISFLSFFLFF